jgi:hypothetical protein
VRSRVVQRSIGLRLVVLVLPRDGAFKTRCKWRPIANASNALYNKHSVAALLPLGMSSIRNWDFNSRKSSSISQRSAYTAGAVCASS